MSHERSVLPPTAVPPLDDELLGRLLEAEESHTFETKRVGRHVASSLETMVAFANADGGYLLLGVEDRKKTTGRDRVYGIQENPEAVDELRRLLSHRITPPLAPPACRQPEMIELGCPLRDGRSGSVVVVHVEKSAGVHSLLDGGTFVRFGTTNRQLSAAEITELSMQRGTHSAVNTLVEVPFELLNTAHWRDYAAQRKLTRPLHEAMQHLGLARQDAKGTLRPTKAAVLLFAENLPGSSTPKPRFGSSTIGAMR
jgi:ATP-dependent DNA helicase RecG